jgi:hypothetical protein
MTHILVVALSKGKESQIIKAEDAMIGVCQVHITQIAFLSMLPTGGKVRVFH